MRLATVWGSRSAVVRRGGWIPDLGRWVGVGVWRGVGWPDLGGEGVLAGGISGTWGGIRAQ